MEYTVRPEVRKLDGVKLKCVNLKCVKLESVKRFNDSRIPS